MKIIKLTVSSKVQEVNIPEDVFQNKGNWTFAAPQINDNEIRILAKGVMEIDDHNIVLEIDCECIQEIDTTNLQQLKERMETRMKEAIDNHLLTIKEDYPFDWTSKSYDKQFEKRQG